MPLTISGNISALDASKNLNKSSSAVSKGFEKIASGKRINKGSDDPAGLAIATEMLTRANISTVAARNISDGVSAASIAEGALDSASEITSRLAELATQAANGTLSDQQRSALNNEYQSLSSELDRIAGSTEFNGQSLLNGNNSIDLQVGTDSTSNSQISLKLPNVSSSSLGITSNIATQNGALQSLEQVKQATDTLASARGEIGSGVSRLETAYNNLKTSELGLREASSRILDANIATESANLTANKIQQQASVAIQAQANNSAQVAIKLLS
jgi:flagellin